MPRADLADRAAAAAGAADRLEAAAVELAIVERKTCRVETEADSAFAAAADCIDYTAPAAALSADRRFPVEAEMVHTMIQVGFSDHIVHSSNQPCSLNSCIHNHHLDNRLLHPVILDTRRIRRRILPM